MVCLGQSQGLPPPRMVDTWRVLLLLLPLNERGSGVVKWKEVQVLRGCKWVRVHELSAHLLSAELSGLLLGFVVSLPGNRSLSSPVCVTFSAPVLNWPLVGASWAPVWASAYQGSQHASPFSHVCPRPCGPFFGNI